MSIIDQNLKEVELKLHTLTGVKFLHAFMECSDAIQEGIRELVQIVHDPDTDEEDRSMAMFTLADALFPDSHEGQLGLDFEESEQVEAEHSDELRKVLAEMNAEESVFADRLRVAMEQRGLTQQALAEQVGLGQSAIANMLNRQCRPQRRTVCRFAEALDVTPEELWPER